MKQTKKYWEKMTDQQKARIKDQIKSIITALSIIVATIFGLSSCQVTRSITNESSTIQRGDTSIVIQTKTIETYNALKNH